MAVSHPLHNRSIIVSRPLPGRYISVTLPSHTVSPSFYGGFSWQLHDRYTKELRLFPCTYTSFSSPLVLACFQDSVVACANSGTAPHSVSDAGSWPFNRLAVISFSQRVARSRAHFIQPPFASFQGTDRRRSHRTWKYVRCA